METRLWAVCLSCVALISCSEQSEDRERGMTMDDRLKQDLETVGNMRVYFGHQSVGRNILQGLKDISTDARSSAIKWVSAVEARTISGPLFIESNIGENGKPSTKCDAFRDAMDHDIGGDSLDVAFMKFCYVDIGAETNVEEMFGYYKRTVSDIQREHPEVTVMHMTIPLVTRSAGWKRLVKKIIGRSDASDLEAQKAVRVQRLAHARIRGCSRCSILQGSNPQEATG